MSIAYLFPGQGAQKVGMGRDLYEAFPAAKRVFDQAEDASGLPLRKLCFEGPEEELARTDVCQPAIFTVSAATLAVLADLPSPQRLAALRPAYMAGLSLGEYTALYAADLSGVSFGPTPSGDVSVDEGERADPAGVPAEGAGGAGAGVGAGVEAGGGSAAGVVEDERGGVAPVRATGI